MEKREYKAGDQVFVIYRNPHTPNVANITEAEIVRHPENEQQLALFLHESYHLLAEDDAVYDTYEQAEEKYKEIFDYDQYQ
ncbi:transcriptional regulator SplA domain-containing protein [Fictibacillus enclensis]|uniref:Transcriptional regulator n=1 Tax=Fictibacillus enclensis TaxID=1017270 RepID=A0A0V8JEQ1_9BACL|nr:MULTISPECIES: transcriptional regulator SplA domain-containing protein [Fictibacillus]KSU85508.1 transcriptional regulator [Fictibacillus enclensis]MDM5199437.1 transcriptional regulator SplA domain-containing protein [Fictibacillus enclensis]MDM5338673.1 transcriptional regulator SplA domain-containing protein [Fictibacillus enclensis]RXY98801.1 transcriptional regulator [Fictibacillus sp. S7]WHY70173.1 transcriptional regulator SplA domain-containing protein [Fictibacillus enclensis]